MGLDILLLSNSTMPGGEYLSWPLAEIRHIWQDRVRRVAFVPFAGVGITWDAYADRVRAGMNSLIVEVESVHRASDPKRLIEGADAVVVGGGNTFCLLAELQATGLQEVIRAACLAGKPYLGWSAGANVTCPTICTTNDMPIRQPESFQAMGLIPFQINPHYHNERVEGQGGESRNDRLLEYSIANPKTPVVGLPEGCLLHRTATAITWKGDRAGVLFHQGAFVQEVTHSTDLSGLL